MQILLFSASKGHSSKNTSSRVMVLVFCMSPYISQKSCEALSRNLKRLSSYRANTNGMQILLFSISKGHNSKIRNSESWFLCSARRLMLVNNPVKFHYLRYLKRLSSYRADTICDRRTGGRTTRQNNLSPATKGE